MSGDNHDHQQEDYSICIKVGVFFIWTIMMLYFIAQ